MADENGGQCRVTVHEIKCYDKFYLAQGLGDIFYHNDDSKFPCLNIYY